MRLAIIILLLFFPVKAFTQNTLFESNELLTFDLQADFTELLSERYKEDFTTSGIITMISPENNKLPVKISVRGNYRREESNCEFPPLWLKNRNETDEIDRVKKIKLVTHCNNDPKFEQYLLREYLIYKMYNQFTEASYRVRLCRITFLDGQQKLFTRYAFLIEENKKLAKRIGAKKVKELLIPEDIPDYTNTALISFFQLMIGNTDWYMPDHNIKVYSRKTESDTLYIPYDFDLCGMVNKPGSVPRVGLSIKNIQARYYLGHCRDEHQINDMVDLFLKKQDILHQLVLEFPHMNKDEKQPILDYMNEFYTLLSDPTRIRNMIKSSCSSYY